MIFGRSDISLVARRLSLRTVLTADASRSECRPTTRCLAELTDQCPYLELPNRAAGESLDIGCCRIAVDVFEWQPDGSGAVEGAGHQADVSAAASQTSGPACQQTSAGISPGRTSCVSGQFLAERMNLFGHFETLLHTRFPKKELDHSQLRAPGGRSQHSTAIRRLHGA